MANYNEYLHKTILSQDGIIIDSEKFRKLSKSKGGWIRMYKKTYIEAQEDCVRSLTDLKVWNFFMDKARSDFSISINISKLAKSLGVSRQKIHQFVKRAIEYDVIRKSDDGYELNPFILVPSGANDKNISDKQREWDD